jgi:hypothetical protein
MAEVVREDSCIALFYLPTSYVESHTTADMYLKKVSEHLFHNEVQPEALPSVMNVSAVMEKSSELHSAKLRRQKV